MQEAGPEWRPRRGEGSAEGSQETGQKAPGREALRERLSRGPGVGGERGSQARGAWGPDPPPPREGWGRGLIVTAPLQTDTGLLY